MPSRGGPTGRRIHRKRDRRSPVAALSLAWLPLTGKPPGGHEDSGQEMFEVEKREDGIYVAVEKVAKRPYTVTEVMAQTMVNWGVRRVFGMVGHSNLGLADALRGQEEQGALTYIGVRHEGAASFACSGYAKISGRSAACLTIAGPGATNLLTGLWDAKVDRAPVLALTGQVDVQVLGPGMFQDIDLASAFQAVTRFSQTVYYGSNHAELMALACKNAIVNRDVAHLIFPDDVQTIPCPNPASASGPDGRLGDDAITPSEASLAKALSLIAGASRPIIIAGYGAKMGMDKVIALAEKLGAPVVTTFKGKGQMSDAHPLFGGNLGHSGTPVASWFMNESDLILVFGASFSNHTGIDKSKPIIQVDFDQMMLGKTQPVAAPVCGGIATTAAILTERLGDDIIAQDQSDEIAERWAIWRAEKASRANDDNGRGVNSAAIFASMSRTLPEDAVIAVDVGNNTYSFGRYFECTRQSILMSGYLGSIGFAFPAALGAWSATQDFPELNGRKVVSVSGDGGFGQYLGDFTTAVMYGMDITHILLNNSKIARIAKEQREQNFPVWQTDLALSKLRRIRQFVRWHGVSGDRSGRLGPSHC